MNKKLYYVKEVTIAINNVFREITIIKIQLVEKIQHRGNELSNQKHHQVNAARLNRYEEVCQMTLTIGNIGAKKFCGE